MSALSRYAVDLHIHTCLSPCGDSRMIPPKIIDTAEKQGIDIIGITDHNSAENVGAVIEASKNRGVVILGGMEITTAEEVHILTLFDSYENLMEMQSYVYSHLHGTNDPDAFGQQWVVDAEGYILDVNPKLLGGATDVPIGTLVNEAKKRGGLVIASHVDRESFGIIGQLGFIPEDFEADAIELSPSHKQSRLPAPDPRFPRVFFSDAHSPEHMGGSRTWVHLCDPTVSELKMALQGKQDRALVGAAM